MLWPRTDCIYARTLFAFNNTCFNTWFMWMRRIVEHMCIYERYVYIKQARSNEANENRKREIA